MKRAIVPALFLALLLSIPAVSQDDGRTLREEVDALTKKVEEQDAALKRLQEYVDRQMKQAGRLAKSMDAAEEKGFLLPAPNNDAKRALLKGIRDFAAVVGGGEPKPGDSDEE